MAKTVLGQGSFGSCVPLTLSDEFIWKKEALGQGSFGPRLQLLQSVLDALPGTSDSTRMRTYAQSFLLS